MNMNKQNFFSDLQALILDNQFLYSELIENNADAINLEIIAHTLTETSRVIWRMVDTSVTSITLTEINVLEDSENDEIVYEFLLNIFSNAYTYAQNTDLYGDPFDGGMVAKAEYGEVYGNKIVFFRKFTVSLAKMTPYDEQLKSTFAKTLDFDSYDFKLNELIFLRPMTNEEYNREWESDDSPYSDIAASIRNEESNDGMSDLIGEYNSKLIHYNENYDTFSDVEESNDAEMDRF